MGTEQGKMSWEPDFDTRTIFEKLVTAERETFLRGLSNERAQQAEWHAAKNLGRSGSFYAAVGRHAVEGYRTFTSKVVDASLAVARSRYGDSIRPEMLTWLETFLRDKVRTFGDSLGKSDYLSGVGGDGIAFVTAAAIRDMEIKIQPLRLLAEERMAHGHDHSDADRAALVEVQKKRWMLLKFVYDDAQKLPQGQRQSLDSATISEALAFTADEQHRIEQYLKDKQLIDFVSFGPQVEITAHGIDYVENALSHPDRKTDFFPATTVMNISGGVHHSQIQQGTNRSQQAMSAGLDPASLRELVATIRAQSVALTIAEGRRMELDSDLATIDAQLQSPTPKKGIIRESLMSIKAIIENAGGTLLAAEIIKQLAGM